MEGSVAFGVVTGTALQPRLVHFDEPQPVTDELIALSKPVAPTEVFRFAASFATNGCEHFDASNCRLVQRIVQGLPAVVENLPPCRIRSNYRWWQQEGKAACLRCPQIVTDTYASSFQLRQVAEPNY